MTTTVSTASSTGILRYSEQAPPDNAPERLASTVDESLTATAGVLGDVEFDIGTGPDSVDDCADHVEIARLRDFQRRNCIGGFWFVERRPER